MKRVMCLYRVSTKGQVDPQDDIPMQRRECLEFISRQQDWQFCEEVMEKGVSGYKVSIQKRDVIQDLKNRALRKEFDVLLVPADLCSTDWAEERMKLRFWFNGSLSMESKYGAHAKDSRESKTAPIS